MSDKTERMTTAEYRELVSQTRKAAGPRTIEDATDEASLQSVLMDHLALHGWLVFHDQDSRRNAAGLPDLIAVHPSGAGPVFIECKTQRGRLRPQQQAWFVALCNADALYRLARPDNLDETLAWLDELRLATLARQDPLG